MIVGSVDTLLPKCFNAINNFGKDVGFNERSSLNVGFKKLFQKNY